MSGFFDNAAIDIECPGCGHKHSKTLGWLKSNKYIPCICGARINLDKSNFSGPLEQAEQSIADFERKLGRMFR